MNVVYVDNIDYALVLLRVYDNGYLTSAGFFKEVRFPEKETQPEDVEYILYNAIAATELPVGYEDCVCILSNDLQSIDEMVEYIDAFDKDLQVDLKKAEFLSNSDNLTVLDYDPRPEYHVFSYKDDHMQYAWCLLKNNLIKN